MKYKIFSILFAGLICGLFQSSVISAATPLEQLKMGNNRYITNTMEHPNRSLERRESTNTSQEPFAVILGCSDSRVSPEIIFDQGIGDLFIIRVAGNCLGDLGQESLLYGVLNLHAKLIVVLGHDQCGAIQAVMSGKAAALPGLLNTLQPAVKNSSTLEEAIKNNVAYVRKQIEALPALKALLDSGELQIKGAVYDLTTGAVSFL